MSDPATEESSEPAEPGSSPDPSRWSATAYIAHDRAEPPATTPEAEALATWCTVSALWHPAILAVSTGLPRVEGIDFASSAGPRELIIVAGGQADGLPSGYRVQVEDAGSILVESGVDRAETVRALLSRIGIDQHDPGDELAGLSNDFHALGTAWWWLRDVTVAMGHADGLDHESLAREVQGGAAAWVSGDAGATRNRLRAAFELLTQAREKFYPVDAYIVDICLLDPSLPAGAFQDAFGARAPVTFLAQADAIEAQAAHDPEALAQLREAISEGWADVVGGTYREADDPLLPLASILWQFREGGRVYREHLDGRNVETYARRRFGLYPMLPQIAKAFGFRFAVHLGFDAGRFPLRREAKRLWESPDHSSLETLTRPPLAGDRAAAAGMLPWKLAASMKDDHVATLSIVHWPSPVAGWWTDLRRVAAYSPVLARWVTLNDYFHLTDRPYETFTPEPDAYVTPYIAQAVARHDNRPISGRVEHARLRARRDALETLRAMAATLSATPQPALADGPEIEAAIEGNRHDEARSRIEPLEPEWAGAVARGVLGTKADGRPGFLVINPACVARRAAVLLPGAAANLRPEGPLRAAQFTEEGVWGVVELPAFGFAWVPREPNADAGTAQASTLTVRDRVLRNGSVVVEVDRASGGVRAVMAEGEETARLGQQLIVSGIKSLDAQPAVSRMRCDSFEVEYAGPALIQAVSKGVVTGPGDRALASFRQRVRLWSGRPILELDVTLSNLDPRWLADAADADPWTRYVACRWAWPDPSAMLRRTCMLSPELTEAPRPETPDALDVSTRHQRTALLFTGLAHHQRHGTRMLDTLLVTGREVARDFKLGVVLDQEYPFQAAADLLAPAVVVSSDGGPPRSGPTGWLFLLDNKGVAVIKVELVDPREDSPGWGLAFYLRETTGRSARCRLRTFRNPTSSRQTDFQENIVIDLPTEDDTVLVDLTPHEFARIEVTFG